MGRGLSRNASHGLDQVCTALLATSHPKNGCFEEDCRARRWLELTLEFKGLYFSYPERIKEHDVPRNGNSSAEKPLGGGSVLPDRQELQFIAFCCGHSCCFKQLVLLLHKGIVSGMLWCFTCVWMQRANGLCVYFAWLSSVIPLYKT